MRESTESHWTRFWRERADLDAVYPTAGNVAAQILAEGPVTDRWVLEVGAGSGRDGVLLARAGARTVLLDYSAESLEVARTHSAREGQRCLLVRGDALRMPFRDCAFDVVYHQGLLEHFRDPMPLLRENVRVLRSGSLLLVDVPQRFHLYTVLKQVLIAMGQWFAGWETQFTIGELEQLLRRSGTRVVRRYGAFMIPGLFYRSVRLVLLKARLARLPLDPPPIPVLTPFLGALRGVWERTPWAFYTYFVIGALGRKLDAPTDSAT